MYRVRAGVGVGDNLDLTGTKGSKGEGKGGKVKRVKEG
jgi:hypothetical protein